MYITCAPVAAEAANAPPPLAELSSFENSSFYLSHDYVLQTSYFKSPFAAIDDQLE